MDSVDLKEVNQAFHFSCGKPGIDETRGVMHLYRDDVASSSSAALPVGRKPLLCVLGVPDNMTYADFCHVCDSFSQHMLEMRIISNDEMEDCYSVLIRFDDQKSADMFYEHIKGRQFSSQGEDTSQVLFTVEVQYLSSIEHAQASPLSSTEYPFCPVCFEKLDQDTSGIFTTICNHSFHCSCISKWTDSSCPVCCCHKQRLGNFKCFCCQTSENLRICVTCGFVGCMRHKKEHAVTHWKETQHCNSLELETNRLWDYVDDNYVDHLIQSQIGESVKSNQHCGHDGDECGGDPALREALFNSKVEAITKEYKELRTTLLEKQKTYYESLLQKVEEDTECATSEAVDKSLRQDSILKKLNTKPEKCVEEKNFLDDKKEIWEAKIAEYKEWNLLLASCLAGWFHSTVLQVVRMKLEAKAAAAREEQVVISIHHRPPGLDIPQLHHPWLLICSGKKAEFDLAYLIIYETTYFTICLVNL